MGRSTSVPAIKLSGTAYLQGCDLDIPPNSTALSTSSYLVDDD